MKIEIQDPDRARDCVQWLMKNIGPAIQGTSGTVIRGEGWTAYVQFMDNESKPVVKIELNQHVDEQDITMFMLRWA